MAAQKQVLRTGEWVDSPSLSLSLALTRDASLSATPCSFLAWSIRLSRSGVDRLGVARKISAAVYEARAKSFFTANGRTLSTIASSCHGSTVPMPHPTPRPTLHTQCLVPRAAASYQLSATWYRCRCPLPVARCRFQSLTQVDSLFIPATHGKEGYFNLVLSTRRHLWSHKMYIYIPDSVLTGDFACLYWFISL